MPADDGFTSAVFVWHPLPVRHGASLPVCPAIGPAGVGTFSAQTGATPGVQKARHARDHQQTRLRRGRLFPDPSPLEIGSSRRLQTKRAIAAWQ